MLIRCPWCGDRDIAEFTYGRDAAARPADTAEVPDQVFVDYVFLRDNPRGRTAEHWQHTGGCRAWIRVERDTLTHEVYATALAQTAGETS
ncbi:MAG TPA: sarcosine oxidase subunit delta [Stellaceae bacterium]|nr:sarcosine oxidase subunit delta [Stellaceae bacterium]